MKTYTAKIAHTEYTIKTLIKCQDRLCHPVLNYMGGAGCIFLVVLAVMLQPYIGRANTAIFSFIGCIGFVMNRNRPIQLIDDIFKRLNGKMPVINYSFSNTGIVVKREKSQETIPYDQITGLAENAEYCFFIYQKKAAFMFKKDTADNLPALKEFLENRTKLTWTNVNRRFKIKKVF